MSKTSRRRKIIANLRNKHRFVLINDTTFAEVFSVRLTPINVLMVFSSLLLAFTVIVLLLLAYTPLRGIVPNALTKESRKEILQLNQKIEDLSRTLEVQRSKQDVLNAILEGNENQFDSTSARPK
jgi:septal ring factor EnvC (AmiA/AmiB activator)